MVRDTVDPVEDDLLADFVIGNHQRMHPDAQREEAEQQRIDADTPATVEMSQPERDPISGVEIIPQALLRKYIAYARDNIHPRLEIDSESIAALYSQLRQESMQTGSIAITVRNVESMIRIAEAHAKLHLRTYVSKDDVDTATRIMLECFISTQKASVMKQMRQV